MQVSVIIPAMNEGEAIRRTVTALADELRAGQVAFEIIVVHGRSKDHTEAVLAELAESMPEFSYCNETPPYGFGHAVRRGFTLARGEFVCLSMADGSDSPADLLRYLAVADGGCDAVFGSRFIRGGSTAHYPPGKLVLNRLFNFGLSVLFLNRFNDYTNAFKLYRRAFLERIGPLQAGGFEITAELPLKCIRNGARYRVVPIHWQGSDKVSALNIQSNIRPYLLATLRCLRRSRPAPRSEP